MKYKLLLLLILASLVNIPSALAARQSTTTPSQNQSNRPTPQGQANQQNQQNQQQLQNQGDEQVNKPNATGAAERVQNRFQRCQAAEVGIKTRSMNMTQFSLKLMETFGTMANRADDFYQKRTINRAATQVQNYTTLKNEVQKKKAAAVAANTQAQNSLLNFNCSSKNPSEDLKAFNANMAKVKNALKEYQGAVKNLTQAVKTAAQKGGQQ